MLVPGSAYALTFISAITRAPAVHPLRLLWRHTGQRWLPPTRPPWHPYVLPEPIVEGPAATILVERRPGPTPTIVLGGFVPDATEQVFMLRKYLRRQGSIYYFNYPPHGFSLEAVAAQLDALVEDIDRRFGQAPVILGVSFGVGVLLHWLRAREDAGRPPRLAGTVLVSPVACSADLVEPDAPKPSTLLGRAVKPFLETTRAITPAEVEKSRALFARMFEAGAQNKTALAQLMSPEELQGLRAAVMATIAGIDYRGAVERVSALANLLPLAPDNRSPRFISHVPTLVLYAEKEGSVLTATSPTRQAIERSLPEMFPLGQFEVVANPGGSPVQHASLIFHAANFLPPLGTFYSSVKNSGSRHAA